VFMPEIGWTKGLGGFDLWNSFEPVTVTDQRRKTFNVRSEMITPCKLNIQKYRETIAALEEQAGK
jgi:hypothetical protein